MFDDSRPIFLQLADDIEREILRGSYAEGERVASTNELSAFHRINPATAGKALNLLVERGVLVKQRGIGMIVADGARDAIRHQRTEQFAAEYVDPLLREARELGIDAASLERLVQDRLAASEASDQHPHKES